MTTSIVHNLADYVHARVAKAREELAWIERTIANEGANAMDKVRAAINRLEGHFDGMHAAATTAKADVALAAAEAAARIEQAPRVASGDPGTSIQGIERPGVLIQPDDVNARQPDPFVMPLTTTMQFTAPPPVVTITAEQPTTTSENTPPHAAEPAAPAPGAD